MASEEPTTSSTISSPSPYSELSEEIPANDHPRKLGKILDGITGRPGKQDFNQIKFAFVYLMRYQPTRITSQFDEQMVDLYGTLILFRSVTTVLSNFSTPILDYIFNAFVTDGFVETTETRFYFMAMVAKFPSNYYNSHRIRTILTVLFNQHENYKFHDDIFYNLMGARVTSVANFLVRQDFYQAFSDYLVRVNLQLNTSIPECESFFILDLLAVPGDILAYVKSLLDSNLVVEGNHIFGTLTEYYKLFCHDKLISISQLAGMSDYVAHALITNVRRVIKLLPRLEDECTISYYRDSLKQLETLFSRHMESYHHFEPHNVIKSIMRFHGSEIKQLREEMNRNRVNLYFYLPPLRPFLHNPPPPHLCDQFTKKLMLMPVKTNTGIVIDKSTYVKLKMENSNCPITDELLSFFGREYFLQDEVNKWLEVNMLQCPDA